MLDPEDEDTIEMELTPSQIAGLEAAAEQAEREAAAVRYEPARAWVEAPPRLRQLPAPAIRVIATTGVPARPVVVTSVASAPVATTQVAGKPVAGTSVVIAPVAATRVAARPVAATSVVIAPVATTPVASSPVAGLPVPIPRVAQSPRSASKGRRYLAIAGAAVVVAVSVATAYQLGTLSRDAAPPANKAVPPILIERQPASDARLPEVTLPPPKAVPVRFANPFDASEVFEFPPGTSEAEARDAVADVLLKRAQQRQMRRPDDASLARRS